MSFLFLLFWTCTAKIVFYSIEGARAGAEAHQVQSILREKTNLDIGGVELYNIKWDGVAEWHSNANEVFMTVCNKCRSLRMAANAHVDTIEEAVKWYNVFISDSKKGSNFPWKEVGFRGTCSERFYEVAPCILMNEGPCLILTRDLACTESEFFESMLAIGMAK